MIDIEEYILKPQTLRQLHLRLDEPCIERGGGGKNGTLTSTYCRGLLAEQFDTTIPTGMKILVCHACNNSRCSNTNHLYWGTAKENVADGRASGRMKTIREYAIAKYGATKFSEMEKTGLQKGRDSKKRKNQTVRGHT